MSKRAVLALASEAPEALLSAALASQGVAVTTVPPSAHLETEVMRARHGAEEPPLVVLDLAVLAQLTHSISGFCAWKGAHCPDARLVLTCSNLLAIHPAEKFWARRNGALDLLGGCSALHWRETVVPVLRALLAVLDITALDETKLTHALASLPKSYREAGSVALAYSKIAALGALGIGVDDIIRKMRGLGGIELGNKRYHLERYPECFVGTQAVDWVVRETGITREQAAQVGQTLLELGHIYHVAREQPFRDGHYFYRFVADSARLAAIDLNDLLARFRSPRGVPIKDRTYHGITFPMCFVGAEAVDWLINVAGLSLNEAMTLGQRLIDLSIIHHVVDEHPFKDGQFFYRFYEDERRDGS